MFELITEGVKIVRNLVAKTPKKARKVRNAGAVMLGAGGASFMFPPEFVEVVPEPYLTILRGALMVVGGFFAIAAQSRTDQSDGKKTE